MLIALVGISFTLFFAFWAYSIKRRLNVKLEKQVEIRTQELNLSREHYQRLFEHSPVAMLELDLSLLSNYVNSIGIPLDSMDQVDRNFSNDMVREGIKFIKVVNVNKAALKLLGFENKSDAVKNYAKNQLRGITRNIPGNL
ncbi:MAG TPA: PAS domain-containing protein [Bacteroidales bacterium]|nr:PAS domain-containing protein [Bacteroidales bacterium]